MIFEKLGLFGMQKIEKPVLAGVVSGEPVLLVGNHGSAKTLLCARLAAALGEPFWAYDASKAMFEDVIGFPSPASLDRGEVEYAPTPVSIWGKQFVLVDELSRAAPSMQSKWLEVIRSRKLMGKRLPDLRHVFGAMNPPRYLGAHPLDEALAGRFAVVACVPDARDMAQGEVRAIISNVAEEDAPGLRAGRRAPADPGAPPKVLGDLTLAGLVGKARARARSLGRALTGRLETYVMEFSLCLQGKDVALDGRRLGMMFRTLKAYLCVCELLGGGERRLSAGLAPFGGDILDCACAAVPFAALDLDVSPTLLRGAHDAAMRAAAEGTCGSWFIMPREPVTAARCFVETHRSARPDERKAAVTRILGGARREQPAEQAAPSLAAVVALARAACEGKLDVAPDDRYRILECYRRLTSVRGEATAALLEVVDKLAKEDPERSFEGERGMLALRAAYGHLAMCERHVEKDGVVKLAELVEKLLPQFD